jgi:phosphoribosylformimino-5-aminoimidazole carboxamide ribotide isomerase
MIALPAVDLRHGRCVQLVGGRPEEEKVSLPDPVARAVLWWEMGFNELHIVDLDAALSEGHNRGVIREIVASSGATIQVGGGVRDTAAVEEILGLGVERVIVGTRAIDDPRWLEETAEEYPHQILVAADVRGGLVLRKGWTESSGIPIEDLLSGLDRHPLAGILCTDVSREGKMQGIDLKAAETVIQGTRHPAWISGGITTLAELRALDVAGAVGAVLGMAIYTGVISPKQVAKEFGA